ncbi:MAG TPA: DMT family transporter [Methylophilaceae bacterium]
MSSTQATKQKLTSTFGLLFAATVWGIIWYPYRLLEQAGISGAAASALTYAIALLIGCMIYAHGWRTAWKIPVAMLPIALTAGWANLAYVMAVIDGSVMRILLLFYLAPFWTLFLSYFLLNERPGKRGVAVVALSLAGAFVMLSQPGNPPIPQSPAEWLALSAGLSFALTNVLTRRATHLTIAHKSFSVWIGVVVSALLYLPFAHHAMPQMALITAHQWLVMAGLGGLLTLTTLSVQYGLSNTIAARASVIFLFELVVGAVSSWYFAHEAMVMHEWIGGLMIIAAAIFAPNE